MRYLTVVRLAVIALVLFAVLNLAPSLCYSAVYYVDNTSGQDTNDGLSQTNPLQSLDKVSKLVLSPGDQVLLKRGEKWEGKIKCTASGNDSERILFGAYGEGDKPVIENMVEIKTWQALSGGSYSHSIMADWCYGFFEDGKKVKEASSKDLTDGRWYFDRLTHFIYYKPESSVLPVCHYVPTYFLLLLKPSSYVTVENIKFQYSGGGIVVEEGGHIVITNCEINYIYEQGVNIRDTTGYCEVRNNTMYKCGDGIYLMNNCQGHNVISENKISYCNYYEYNNNDGHAVGIQNCSDNIITRNELSYCITPICLWAAVGRYTNNTVISYNIVSDCKRQYQVSYNGKGIAIVPEEDNHAAGNLIHHNVVQRCNFGMKLNRTNSPGNYCYNNIFDDCGVAIVLSRGCDNAEFINNVFLDSDIHHIESQHAYNGANNLFSNNCYFPDIVNGYVDRSIILNNFAAWKASIGFEENSFTADPKLMNPGDYHLQDGSPCTKAGKDIIAKLSENLDFSRGNSYDPGIIDIGVYKSVSTTLLSPPLNLREK